MSRRLRRSISAILVLAAIGAAIVYGPGLWHKYGDRLFSSNRCTATVDGETSELTSEQASNAALIVATGMRRGLSDQALTIALATALQESDLRNLELGDRDSLGLFQQRPSQGWGTAAQVMDPYFATNAFFDALIRVDGWEEMSVTEAAQAVQRSGFPEAYADHEYQGRVWARALSGQAGPDAISCTLDAVDYSFDPAADLLARIREDHGPSVTVRVAPTEGGLKTVTLETLSNRRDALAAWAVAIAGEHPIVGVSVCWTDWTRDRGEWLEGANTYGEATCTSGQVLIILGMY